MIAPYGFASQLETNTPTDKGSATFLNQYWVQLYQWHVKIQKYTDRFRHGHLNSVQSSVCGHLLANFEAGCFAFASVNEVDRGSGLTGHRVGRSDGSSQRSPQPLSSSVKSHNQREAILLTMLTVRIQTGKPTHFLVEGSSTSLGSVRDVCRPT